ncbi:MAG: DUF5615 family PIN-like protein [Acidiferrobacterales bacterium]
MSRCDSVVLTHDLDFSAILAATRANAPSVIQVLSQDVLSELFQNLLIEALRRFASVLVIGALVIVDESRSRAYVLPRR